MAASPGLPVELIEYSPLAPAAPGMAHSTFGSSGRGFTTVLTADGLTERQRDNRLRKFHEKLGSLTFFDPACGSGNFLTETYIELRRLENVVIGELLRNQTMFDFEEVGDSPVKVSLHQFYGIEDRKSVV